MLKKYKSLGRGFTLPELLVSITIIAILSTLGTLSYLNYTSKTRDTVRSTDIKSINTVLTLHNTKILTFPKPTNAVAVTYSGATVWTQGVFGKDTMIETGKIFGELRDPKYKNQYTYSVTENRKEYQLGVLFENQGGIAGLLSSSGKNPLSSFQAYAADPFDPLELSPKVWLDAMDIDADGDTGDNPANNTAISEWKNKSLGGNSLDAVITSGTVRYTTVGFNSNNRSVFIPENAGLRLPNSDITQGDIFYVVQKRDPFGSTDSNGLGLQSSTANNYLIGYSGNHRHSIRINSAPNQATSSPATTSNRTNPYIYSFHTDNINYSFRDTGSAPISQGAVSSISGQVWAFNTAGAVSNQGSDLVISEILIFDQQLSDTNREKVEGYLAHKWGRTSMLPSSHPYKVDLPESSGPLVPPDSSPDAFVFSDMTDVQTASVFSSNTITLSGINTLSPISITGGEYSINGGVFTSASGTVSVGNTLQVRVTSSTSNSTTTSATVNVGGFTEAFSVTTIIADTSPDAFSFSPVNNANLGVTYISNSVTITGLNLSVPVTIFGTGATYRISNGLSTDMTGVGTASASSQLNGSNSPDRAFDNNITNLGWGNNNILPAWLQFDFGAGNSQNITQYTLLRSASQNGGWNLDDYSPSDWVFQASNDATTWTNLDTQVGQTISQSASKRQFSVSNTQYFRYYRIFITASNRSGNNWVNITEMELISEGGGSFVSTQSLVQNGDIISIRMPAAASPATIRTANIVVGSGSASYSITTLPLDTTPDNFSFPAVTNAPVSSLQTSDTIIVSGINASTPISISGVGQYRINLGSYTASAGTVQNGDTITLQQNASPSNSQTTSSTLNIGGITASYHVSTVAPPPDTIPDTFSFTDITGASTGTLFTSNMITISGINASTSLSISGGTYSKNNTAYTSSAGTVQNGDTISLRNTSSSSFSTAVNSTLNIGGVTDIFTITTLAPDTTPDSFTLSSVSDAQLNQQYISNSISIVGINTASPISIAGGAAQYSINGAAWRNTSSSVNMGDIIQIRMQSAPTGNTTTSSSLNIGGVSRNYIITTLAPDTTPDSFVFQDITGATLNTPYISDTITVSGINTPISLSITGGEYRIGATGSFTSAPGVISNGQQLTLRLNTALGGNITTNTIVIMGGLSDTFSVTTRSLALGDIKNLDTPVSNVSITGNYNGLLVHAKNNTTHYILASPSIMSYDLSNPDFLHIINQKKLVYDGFKNLPSSYSGFGLTMSGGFDFPISAPLLYEGGRSDLGSYGGLKQIDEGIKSNYNSFPAYSKIASYMDDYSLGYLENIIGNVIGINPIKPFYCSDILRSKLVANIAPFAQITASTTANNTYGTGGIANGITSTAGDLDYEYHSQDGNASIFFEWPSPQKIGFIKIYNRTGCCSDRLSGANIKLYGAAGNLLYSHALWNTTGDFVVDLDLESIGQLHDVKTLSLQTVNGNLLNLREVEIYLGGNVKDGEYKVDKDGLGGQSRYNVYCDMTTDGGGWTRIGQNFIENGNFEQQSHVQQYTFSGANQPLTDNVIMAQITQAPPKSLPDAFVLQHNGSINDSYQLFFPKIPGEYFAQEIRLSGWVRGTTSSIFSHIINYESTTTTNRPDYSILEEEQVSGWKYQMVRIPLTGLVKDFTWNLGKDVAGPFFVTGLKMEVYYR